MKAAVWHARKDVRIEEIAEPSSPEPGWVKIEVAAVGLCGTDLHEYAHGPIFTCVDQPHPLTGHQGPVVMGHEFSGKVVELGEGVDNVTLGDRVASMGGMCCGECHYCQQGLLHLCLKGAMFGFHINGAFTRYINVPATVLFPLPNSVTDVVGAMVEPYAVGLHAVRQAMVRQGDTVVVLGAGPIGLTVLQSALAEGADKVFVLELSTHRQELAMQLGAAAVIDPGEVDPVEEIKRLTDGLGADVAIECIGHKDTAPLAVSLIKKAGCVVLAGMFTDASTINFLDVAVEEKRIVGSFGYLMEFPEMIQMFSEGKIDPKPLHSKTIALDDLVTEGFEALLSKDNTNIKIIIEL
ncbi:2,3-butanediol dehydrogenase [Desulforhopalus singaporensis]|uniref:(R,R)-butanediol dehydrogenase / meso-butanediol dehydrogenase / diacetyl reductase n=1 Tax=Desulforhopalus singaporensis TaxID=91360 RepID=A0A1H0T1E3_9BACT|nr:2,3-butanediol dehydrogenase [Desulforhopalus singaporensis]SDP47625.1 (R,R)-butanediol dehydrogenase / meso-butanediol dehydrogenase / diacetyl reductase [Desulforhopalus singaporensis]